MPYEIFSSDRTPITQVITLPVSSQFSHCFGGIRYFDADGEQITPSGGTVTIEARHVTNNFFDTVIRSILQANTPGIESEWGGNVTEVRATPASLAGAGLVTYQLVVVQNQN